MRYQSYLLLVAVSLLFCSCSSRPQEHLRVAAQAHGAYGSALHTIWELPGNPAKLRWVELGSPGSITTLQQIQKGKLDAGLVQGDVIHLGVSVVPVRALDRGYFFIMSPIPANSLAELVQKAPPSLRIGTLHEGSQSWRDLERLIETAGVSRASVQVHGGNHDVTIQRLLKGEIDAAFFITGINSPTIAQLRSVKSLHLIPVQGDEWNGVSEAVLPAGAVLPNQKSVRT